MPVSYTHLDVYKRQLYYSMSCAVYGQLAQASIYGLQTFQCALGIGTGMSIVWALCDFSRKMQAWWKERE